MLLAHLYEICIGTLLLILVIWIIALYTYIVDQNRTRNDPKKQDYPEFAVVLAPITFPLFAILIIFFFLLRILLFAAFIAVFTVLLIAIRKPFIFKLWDSFATWIGDPMLKLNTILIRAAFRR